MTDREAPVKRYELEQLAGELKRDREQAAKDRQLDREQAAQGLQEIKELLKENNRIMREGQQTLRNDVFKEIDDIKENFVKNDKLTIRLSPYEPIRKFFWWVAGGMGAMLLATAYQLIINGVKSL